MNNLPNFLIVGTAKAATTTIHEYLKQHPDIFMTEWKEPCFFTFKDKDNIKFKGTKRIVKFITKKEEYIKLFDEAESHKIRGESSTPYLYFYRDTIENIKHTIPNYSDVKILIILRNPTERAFSQYMMKIRDLEENISFSDAIKNEKDRMLNNHHFDFYYVDRGLYFEQVKAYLEHFNKTKIVLYEDFKNAPLKTLNEIVKFLDLKKIDFNKITERNVSGRPKNKIISKLLIGNNIIKVIAKKFIPRKYRMKLLIEINKQNLNKEKIDQTSLKYLNNFYKDDINKLEALTGIDLSHWK